MARRGLVAGERLPGQLHRDHVVRALRRRELRRAEHRLDGLPGPVLERLAGRERHRRVLLREVLEREEHDLGERLEHSFAARGDRAEVRAAARVQPAVERLELHHVRQVALVVLQDHRDRGRVELLRQQVPLELAEALLVLVPAVGRRVGDEHDAVRAAQDDAARGRVDRLAGHRRELEAQVVAHEARRLERQEVAEDRAVLLRVHRHELAAAATPRAVVEHLQVGGFSADRRAVVGDLDSDRSLFAIELDHAGCRDPVPGL